MAEFTPGAEDNSLAEEAQAGGGGQSSARDRGSPGGTRCCGAHPLPAAPSQGAPRDASPEGGLLKEPELLPLFILTPPIDSIFIVMQELVYAFLIFIIITWQGAVVQLREEREGRGKGWEVSCAQASH